MWDGGRRSRNKAKIPEMSSNVQLTWSSEQARMSEKLKLRQNPQPGKGDGEERKLRNSFKF